MTNDVLGGRFVLREDDGTWWELGWDRHLATYWAQHLTTDAYGVEQILAWHGADPREAPTLNTLTNAMGRPLPREIAQDLQRSRLAEWSVLSASISLSEWTQERPERRVPHVDFGSRWIDPERPDVEQRVSWVPTTGELYAVDRRSGDGVQQLAVLPTHDAVNAAMDGWAAVAAGGRPHLTWLQQRLEELQIDASEQVATAGDRRALEACLPASPAAAALASLVGEAGIDDDPSMIARGLDLDHDLVVALLAGTRSELGVEEVASVCEALHCSPYDLWGPQDARTILDSYGPEKWPRHIEPLDDLRRDLADDDFVSRRVNAQAASQVTVVSPTVHRLHATCYRTTSLIAFDPADGSTRPVEPTTEVSPNLEYHYAFRQIAGTLAVATTSSDLDPNLLAEAAQLLRNEPWLSTTSMVHFVDPTTDQERWLGRTDPEGAWEEWDDPRDHYPGDPADVLEPDIHAYTSEIAPRPMQLTSFNDDSLIDL